MTKSGDDVRYLPQIAADKQDRLVKENPVDEIFKEMGLTQEQVREAFQRIRDERDGLYWSHLGGRVDEICETCCDAHLQIIFQREKKVIAKGKTTETWYATVGTMTVRKLAKKKWPRINLRPVQEGKEEKLPVPPEAYGPQFSVETLLTSDYVEPGYEEPDEDDFDERYAEKGVPGTGRANRKGEKNMVRAATHGLAAWGHGGSKHHTYNHSREVGPDKRPHRALNIKKNGTKQSKDLMGKREAINIHVSQNWK